MPIAWLLDQFKQYGPNPAVIYQDREFSYGWLIDQIAAWQDRLDSRNVMPGQVVALASDYSPKAIALLLALIGRRNIIVPLTSVTAGEKQKFLAIAEVQVVITLDDSDEWQLDFRSITPQHNLIQALQIAQEPGLIVFSSGSTGDNKAALHSFDRLLEKYKKPRHRQRILVFLLLDHLGGINTLFHTLANGGAVITPMQRTPEEICRAIERYQAQVLPTSPTFLNLLLLSAAYQRFDLSSLELITYGTEVMPESTLRRVRDAFPNVRLLQTYGLTELGVMRSKSRASDSLWVKVGGEGFETKVVNGTLFIRAQSAMLGYLNAPSPFDADGWMNTGDKVEVDGEWIRILGRESEIINVGGRKVYPAEVEGVLQLMDGVEDVVVSAEPHPITGQIVAAKVKISTGESISDFRKRMREFCRDKLSTYMIPQKVVLVDKPLYGKRFKRIRKD